ncbi:STAS domain-containing protein [Streptomyces sp. NPDC044984]|uniref:STAS domain-containing protein n=1 Tax=unclassified Streptomyces TaxID=2593676 RepID=UPI0033CF3F27
MAETPRPKTEQAKPTRQVGGLSVVAATTDGIRVLTLAGEIDHHTGDQLRQALDASDTAHPRIVVDLHDVTFMDSSGINILIAAHQTVTAAGGRLRLAAPTDSVQRVLQLTGVDTLVDCYPTLRRALTP